jgi:anti-sigma-K factor RskA
LVNGKPVDVGLLTADCNGLCKLKTIPEAQAFAITLENKGGSATPHLDQLYVMGKIAG